MSEPTSPSEPPAYGERVPGYVPPPPAPPAPTPGYTYAAPAYGTPGYGAPGYGAPVKRRRTWDLVLTIALLVLGLFGMLIGLFYAWAFSDPELLDQALGQSGYGGFDGVVGAAPAVIAISHVALYLVALGVSIPLLIGKKIAFWVPLAAGVIAAIVFWASAFSILASDPNLIPTVPVG